jgi:putative nucleotidyltransferase with HDIG domain
VNTLLTKIRDKHALWYKGIIFVFCVIICTYLLPKKPFWYTNPPKTHDVWQYDHLISDIDFLVKKTNEELSQEKHTQQHALYFEKEEVDVAELIKKFPEAVDLKQRKVLKNFLDSVYTIGFYYTIAGTPAGHDSIYLVKGNEVELVNTSHLYNDIQVKERLKAYLTDAEKADLVFNNLPSNIGYDDELNKTIVSSEEKSANIYKTKIKKGDVLIHKNDIITDEQANLIVCYKQELDLQLPSNSLVLLVQVLACGLILGIMMLFLAFFRKAIFSQNTHVTFIFLVIILIVIASNAVYQYNAKYMFAVPFCLVPVLIRVFFDSRTALFNFLNVVLLCSFFMSDKFEFVFIQLITGIGTIFSVADMGKRSKLFVSAMLTLVFYISSYAAYHLVNDTSVVLNDLTNYIPFLISSLCVLFSFPLIFLFEKLFGFVSDFTLLELCDLNSPLLRQLSQKVPGTFQHSLQVANLAEEACYKIGGNALLVRTGAMYHDIGKMEHPRFFTENQVGEVSPHEDLSAEESAQIIIEHVIKGVEIAKANKLPETIIDFIRTHHGTTTTRYFLYNYKKQHEGEKINEDLFRYPGPIPFSKETAILMMADGVEASSRSLKKYDAIAIDELVDRIIDYQIGENQFLNADITFRDINQIKKIFKKRLMNIYHVRIEYPR